MTGRRHPTRSCPTRAWALSLSACCHRPLLSASTTARAAPPFFRCTAGAAAWRPSAALTRRAARWARFTTGLARLEALWPETPLKIDGGEVGQPRAFATLQRDVAGVRPVLEAVDGVGQAR